MIDHQVFRNDDKHPLVTRSILAVAYLSGRLLRIAQDDSVVHTHGIDSILSLSLLATDNADNSCGCSNKCRNVRWAT